MKLKLTLQELEVLVYNFFPWFSQVAEMKGREYATGALPWEDWLNLKTYFTLLEDLHLRLQTKYLKKKSLYSISLTDPEAIALFKGLQVIPSAGNNVWLQLLIGRLIGDLDQYLKAL